MGRISVIIQEGLYTGESTLEKSPLNVVKSGSAFSSNMPSECNECGNCFILKKSLVGIRGFARGESYKCNDWENLQLPLKPDSPLEDSHWEKPCECNEW